MNKDRLVHSLAVARKCFKIALEQGLSEEEVQTCFLIGYLHDIGYEFTSCGVEHNKIGGEILKRCGFSFWREVYFHGEIDHQYESLYLKILNQADMQVDKYGNDIGFDRRLEDIKSRYGEESEIYRKCCQFVDEIR